MHSVVVLQDGTLYLRSQCNVDLLCTYLIVVLNKAGVLYRQRIAPRFAVLSAIKVSNMARKVLTVDTQGPQLPMFI